MKSELDSLHRNDVWDLCDLPQGRKAVGSKWVFKRKYDVDGSIERYKAMLLRDTIRDMELIMMKHFLQ